MFLRLFENYLSIWSHRNRVHYCRPCFGYSRWMTWRMNLCINLRTIWCGKCIETTFRMVLKMYRRTRLNVLMEFRLNNCIRDPRLIPRHNMKQWIAHLHFYRGSRRPSALLSYQLCILTTTVQHYYHRRLKIYTFNCHSVYLSDTECCHDVVSVLRNVCVFARPLIGTASIISL